MKKLFPLLLVSIFIVASCQKEETEPTVTPDGPGPIVSGLLSGEFSVSESRQVRFASGNLDYIDGYCFAPNQYDYGGYFGWGTGSNPTITSTEPADYSDEFDDWGSYIAGGWRTLTIDEWVYMMEERPNATSKCGIATVCGILGMIVLPDNWEGPAISATFTDRDANIYDESTWSVMEQAGALFLPAAGNRFGTSISSGEYGNYWSSSLYEESKAESWHFGMYNNYDTWTGTCWGMSVRLAKDN